MSDKAADAIVVMMTAPDRDEARRIADLLVAKEVAACVQMIPGMQSVYRWEGKIEEQAEILLIAKTLSSKLEELEKEVRAIHSYETPEIIALPVTAGSERYLEWLAANVS